MARGQYELPPGRPKPAFGPSRPPIYPPRSPSNSSPASTSSSPTSPLATQSHRADVIILSITKSERYERAIKTLKTELESEANIEEVGKVDEAVGAFARRPTAVVVMSEDALQEASLETEADRYVQNGGILITDPSQALLAVNDALKAKNESTGDKYGGANRQVTDESPKLYDRFEQVLLQRTKNDLYRH